MTDDSSATCPSCGAALAPNETCKDCMRESSSTSHDEATSADATPSTSLPSSPVLNDSELGHASAVGPANESASSPSTEDSDTTDGETESLDSTQNSELNDVAVLAEVISDDQMGAEEERVAESDDSVVGAVLVEDAAGEGNVNPEDHTEAAQEAELIDDENQPRPRSPFAPDHRLGLDARKRKQDRKRQDYYAAKGGSVGALTLGIMAIPGAFITPASAVTALIGIGMGIWGLLSQHRRMALIGLLLCVVALALILLRGVLGISDMF